MNLNFTSPVLVQTPWGAKLQEIAEPTPQFWYLWREASDSLKSIGIYVRKTDGKWHVGRLRNPPPDDTPATEASGYMLRDFHSLKEFQIPHAGALCASMIKNGHALDGSDTGTGKTYTAAAVARELKLIPAVVCTPRNILKWQGVLRLFGLQAVFICNWEHPKTGKLPFAHVLKQGRKTVTFDWRLKRDSTLLILDEAQNARGLDTIASQMLISAKPYKTLAMSASFATSPKDMKALGYLLNLHTLENFKEWLEDYSTFSMPDKSGRFTRFESVNPADEMNRLNKIIYPAHGSRMRIADIPGFPETQITAELYEIENAKAQNDEYDRLLTELASATGKGDKKPNELVAEIRYRQIAEILKVDLLADLAKEDMENGLSVLIFVNYTATLKALAEKLNTNCIVAGTGVQTHKANMNSITAFQRNVNRLIILNAQAGGDSIDLHDVHGGHPRSSLISPMYNAITLKQIFGRPHRDGAKSKSLQKLVYSKGTVEEKIYARVSERLNNINALNDGDLAEPELLAMGRI